MPYQFALVALISTLMCADAAAVMAASLADVACRLAMPASLSRNSAAVATMTLHNRGKQTISILKRNTPLEGWLADSLTVTRDDQPVTYSGAMAKRMPPSVDEYLRLKPGTRHRYRMALQRGYDVSLPGHYQVRWKGELLDVQLGGAIDLTQPTPLTLTCNAVTFTRTP